MKRIMAIAFLVSAFTLLTVGDAVARQPLHEKATFSSDLTFPAGFLCDFDLRDAVVGQDNRLIYGDPANPSRITSHITASETFTNLETGATLSGVAHYTGHQQGTRFRQVGLDFHLRTADGKLAVVSAGLVIIDFGTFEVVKNTPHKGASEAQLCTLLGGSPAG